MHSDLIVFGVVPLAVVATSAALRLHRFRRWWRFLVTALLAEVLVATLLAQGQVQAAALFFSFLGVPTGITTAYQALGERDAHWVAVVLLTPLAYFIGVAPCYWVLALAGVMP